MISESLSRSIELLDDMEYIHERNSFTDKDEPDIIVKTFSNGYEQGFCLTKANDSGGLQCCFALSKNKNDFVVYFGRAVWFDIKTNRPVKDTDWLRRVYFSELKEVSSFIFEFMNNKRDLRNGTLIRGE